MYFEKQYGTVCERDYSSELQKDLGRFLLDCVKNPFLSERSELKGFSNPIKIVLVFLSETSSIRTYSTILLSFTLNSNIRFNLCYNVLTIVSNGCSLSNSSKDFAGIDT